MNSAESPQTTRTGAALRRLRRWAAAAEPVAEAVAGVRVATEAARAGAEAAAAALAAGVGGRWQRQRRRRNMGPTARAGRAAPEKKGAR